MLTSLRTLRIASIAIPVIACAAWGQQSWSSQYEHAVERASRNVRIVGEYVLRVVLTQEALLAQADEATRNLAWDQIAQSAYVHERLRQIGERSDISSSISLIDPTGRIRNSGRVFPVDTSVADRKFFREIAAGATLYVGDRTTSPFDGSDVIAVAKRRGGSEFEGVVAMSLRSESISPFFAELTDDPDAAIAFYDAEGNLLARQPYLQEMTIPQDTVLMRTLSTRSFGTFEAEAATDGVRRLYAYTQVGDFPLFVTYGIAKRTVVDRWLTGMYVACVAALFIALTTWLLTERAIRKARSEAAYRNQLATEVAAKTAHLRDALAERDLLIRSKDELLGQKETLLREVHHRVKNNLQMMASMVRVVSRSVAADARPAFDKVAQRIATVGRAYEHVHRQDDLAQLNLADYLRGICVQIAQSAGRDEIRLETELASINVDIDTALPVGLIAGELVTNAYKHAFPADRGGAVMVRLHRANGQSTLQVQDDGVGIDLERLTRSAGLRIAEALAGQVDGTLSFANRPEGGAEATLTFKVK